MLEVDRSDTSFPLTLTVDKDGLGGVTGLSPTVALRKVGVAGSYLDWADNTFKTSGWTTKYQVMSELEHGNYQQLLNVTLLTVSLGDKLSAEYSVDDGGLVKGESSDLLVISDLHSAVTLMRKVTTNRLEEVGGVTGTLKLYDDDGVTLIKTWPLKDESGGAINTTVGVPARRGAGTP